MARWAAPVGLVLTGIFLSLFVGVVLRRVEEEREHLRERRRARRERARLEEQLRQSAKLEAIGRLAGGVAHDFNNLLTGILGYTEMLLIPLALDDPMRRDLEDIKKSTLRAADLTAQLLTFSRKQIIRPRVLDLNEVLRRFRGNADPHHRRGL